jgi:hypothetical protein
MTGKSEHESLNRREWLTAALRWGALAVLAAIAALPVIRRVGRGGDQACGKTVPCQDCRSLAGCRLPAAIRWRQRQRGDA